MPHRFQTTRICPQRFWGGFLIRILGVFLTQGNFNDVLHAQSAGLSRDQATQMVEQIWQEACQPLKAQLEKEWNGKSIQGENLSLKFLIREFGKRTSTGRSLFISMHGGGGAPARVNDQQWRNQIRLYEPEEGLVVAPRAPSDNWNFWHEAHIDGLFDRLILAAVICADVDPNRVYLMGYSAGGDGVFQLAPRMSDRWAATAMMAGHPNETRPEGLRNVPFGLFMGGKDGAYDRNQHAQIWKEKLAELAQSDPAGYPQLVRIYPESGHWMNSQDREAIPWMSKHSRNCWPKKIVWVQDDVTHSRLYWIGVPLDQARAGSVVTAQVDGQTISIESDVDQILLYLSDELLDLDQPVTVNWNGIEVASEKVLRSEAAIRQSLAERLDANLAATTILKLKKP